MPVIGTAGHVDHGKTTLIQGLTGRNTDRWEEERRRGLTIDLGFAWMDLGDTAVGFVDVPGHERFIRNMLAGVDGIDAALLVVAADEGWMPQTEEHVAVLDLLGIRHGVVALTRVDLVDESTAELATLEVEDRLQGTSLVGARIVRTAAPENTGMAELRATLAEAVAAAPPPADRARPRLWVDRSFVIGGAGTVVTGTMLGGRLRVGDAVTVWPGPLSARIRGIESHEHSSEEAVPGRRTALNLSGLDRSSIARGAMVGLKHQWRPTSRLLASIRTVRRLDAPLTSRGAYHLHAGSGAHAVRVRLLGAKRLEGSGFVALQLDSPLPLAAGDRFILRDVGRRAIVAGGKVLDPHPSARSGSALLAAADQLREAVEAGPDAVAQSMLTIRGRADPAGLSADSGGGTPHDAFEAGGLLLDRGEQQRIADRAAQLVAAYHSSQPLRPGMPRASLASELGLDASVADAIVEADPRLLLAGSAVRHADFSGSWSPGEEEAWNRASAELAKSLAVPRATALGLDEELLHSAVRRGLAIRVADDLVYLPHQIDEMRSRFAELGDGFTVSKFREHFGLSRRHAVPLLEWFDDQGVTVRHGDSRRLKTGAAPAPAPTSDEPSEDDARPR